MPWISWTANAGSWRHIQTSRPLWHAGARVPLPERGSSLHMLTCDFNATMGDCLCIQMLLHFAIPLLDPEMGALKSWRYH